MSQYVQRIVTRGFETDARLRVSIGMLARYFEHVRWEGIRDRGAGLGVIFRDGGKMVLRAQAVRVLRPLVARETLDLALSVGRVGRSSIHFVQVAKVGDEVVARNDTVAVALDASGRPSEVPDAVRARVGGEPVEPLARIPDAPDTFAFRCDVQVRPTDLDALQHVNHSRYIDYVDDVYTHARAAGAYGGEPSRSPAAITIEYERETRIDALGPARVLAARTWRATDDALAFELLDPLDGVRVARAMIRPE
ncbi:MAG: thioesterase family protein [Polyangiales bacterium]